MLCPALKSTTFERRPQERSAATSPTAHSASRRS
jgi:hypothetical protein